MMEELCLRDYERCMTYFYSMRPSVAAVRNISKMRLFLSLGNRETNAQYTLYTLYYNHQVRRGYCSVSTSPYRDQREITHSCLIALNLISVFCHWFSKHYMAWSKTPQRFIKFMNQEGPSDLLVPISQLFLKGDVKMLVKQLSVITLQDDDKAC